MNRKRNAISSISLILILAMSLMMTFAQTSSAQVGVPQPEKTSGYIDVAPRLIGVGQTATVNLFVYPIPTDYAYLAYYDGYRGVTVTFTKPDGSKDTFMPVDATGVYAAGQTESLGAIFFFYEPDMAGNWSVSFTMPDQNLTDITGTVLMTGCTSNTAYFTVQTDPVLAGLVNGYPWSPLPNDNAYWTYPISSNNREWSTIAGDWLGAGTLGANILGSTCRSWQPYGSGPNTGHVVWTQPLVMGGLVGGDLGSVSYGPQNTNTNYLTNTIIIAGKLYVNVPNSGGRFECIDLATGQILYTAAGSISMGIHLPGNSFVQSTASPTGNVVLDNSYGNTPAAYLFGTSGSTWNYYDPLTGATRMSLVNASGSGYMVDGTPLAYVINGSAPNQFLIGWNMTKMASVTQGSLVVGAVGTNWRAGIQWAVPLPTSQISRLPQLSGQYASSGTRLTILGMSNDGSVILIRAAPNEYWGYSTTDGRSLWNLTLNYPAQQNQEVCMYGTDQFVVFDPTLSAFKSYSILTGALQWTSDTFSDSAFATTWTVYNGETNDLENFYAIFPDGTARAYSVTDGHEVWRSTAIASTEYANNAVPFVNSVLLMDGKLYIYAGYTAMYTLNPIPRFGMLVCINATNGDTVFTLNGGLRVTSAANGYVVCSGDYTGYLYGIGKGKTSTSVSVQNNVVTNHATALITGNVLDQTPISAGTPAVADSSMSEWMDYLHMQNATLLNNPPAPKGVPVTLTAVDPNGNTINVGTTTTDSKGNFAVNFVPETAGMYTITASFAGTNGYYSSNSETHLSVVAASETTPGPITQTTVDNTMLLYGIMALVVVAIILAALALIRKH